jgi:hypothetical protein
MTDPKTFYRELDALLANIRIEPSEGDLLPHVINRIETTFGERLHICAGRLYELRGQEFVLTYPSPANPDWAPRIAKDSPTIDLAAKHRSYIYDEENLNAPFFTFPGAVAKTTVIWVHNQGQQWLIVFDLKENWEREEVTLLLNAVRMSLNYRMFSDIIGDRLEHAAEIHKSLLPANTLKVSGYEIHAITQSAELIGGDFYDYYDNEDGSFGVSIGDASGHGIPAALLVRDVVIGLRMGLAEELRLIHTLKKLNTVIQRSTYSTSFVTLFIGEFESDGHLFYANAGHPPPLLITADAAHLLEATGIALGFFSEIKISRSHVLMPPESVLVLFTDGIIERESEPDERFGMERLIELIKQHRLKSSREICEQIFQSVHEFGLLSAWEDDATVVVIKRTGSQNSAENALPQSSILRA